MNREAPAEILSRQRRQLTDIVEQFKHDVAREQTYLPQGVSPMTEREKADYQTNLERIEFKLKKLIVEPTGQRGNYHELLERNVGKHPDFGAKMHNVKVNNTTELARGLNGWVGAKENRAKRRCSRRRSLRKATSQECSTC